MRVNNYKTLLFSGVMALSLTTLGCDTGFLGDGGGKFKSGDSTGQNNDPGNSKEGNSQYNPGNNPGNPFGDNPVDIFDDKGNRIDDPSILVYDRGEGQVTLSPATLTVMRADGAAANKYNHKDVEIELKAGDNTTTGRVQVGSKDTTVQLPNVCTTGGKVRLELAIYHKGQKISPNKSTTLGGIIAYRLSPDAIYVGYEFEALNNPQDVAWHENDDWIARIVCNPTEDGQTVNFHMKNTCFDQRIPDNGQNFIDKNDDADSPDNRVCAQNE